MPIFYTKDLTINELKKEKNLTLKELEKIVGVDYTILSKISNGYQPLTEDIIEKFRYAFPDICIVAKSKKEIIAELEAENAYLRNRVAILEEAISVAYGKAFPAGYEQDLDHERSWGPDPRKEED
jgi:transcriptional regulator with XRE-family HTH domain